MPTFSRRGVLQRLGVLAGGIGALAGTSVTGAAAQAQGSPGPGTAALRPGGQLPGDLGGTPPARELVLHGRGLRPLNRRRPATAGDTHVVRGELTGPAGGEALGELLSTATLLEIPRQLAPSAGSLVTQTFSLGEGTLVGTGVLGADGSGELVVSGGTGAFHGVRGSYRAEMAPDRFGGGDAVFRFHLLVPEGRS